MRWHALWLLQRGYSVAEVVEVVGVHERSVRRWIAWYPSRKYADIGEVGDRGNRRH